MFIYSYNHICILLYLYIHIYNYIYIYIYINVRVHAYTTENFVYSHCIKIEPARTSYRKFCNQNYYYY